jgi:excisionase family DNA binding protein
MNPSEPSLSANDCVLWSTEELARYLGCTSRHVARLRADGLPVIRVGALVRFRPSRVVEWLEGRSRQQAGNAATGDKDNAECAAAERHRELPPSL